MIELILDKKTAFRILKNRNRIEKGLKVKISVGKGKVSFTGEAEDEYVARDVIEAIDAGFSINKALLLVEEDYILEKIHIRDISKKNIYSIKSRIIGEKGKTLSLISELSGCFIELKESDVFVIGHVEDIKDCVHALTCLIRGIKQSNIYRYLEEGRNRRKFPEDLGLR
ncbi:MAG: KH domain-containing protein [Candidatus Omnitrophica bacterium]|nr:KH domain-containing protein [Candidatus Omnitrophota bacterium]